MKKLIILENTKLLDSNFDGNFHRIDGETSSWYDKYAYINIFENLHDLNRFEKERYLESLQRKYVEIKIDSPWPLYKIGLVEYSYFSDYFNCLIICLDPANYNIIEFRKILNKKNIDIHATRYNNMIFLEEYPNSKFPGSWVNEITREQYLEYIENNSNWESEN